MDNSGVQEADDSTVYGEYAKTNNLAAVAVYIFCLLAAQTAQIGMSPSPAGSSRVSCLLLSKKDITDWMTT